MQRRPADLCRFGFQLGAKLGIGAWHVIQPFIQGFEIEHGAAYQNWQAVARANVGNEG